MAHDPSHKSTSIDKDAFLSEWGIDKNFESRGAIKEKVTAKSFREIYLLQRKETKLGKNLGKTTGWIHRLSLKDKGVEMIKSVNYEKIDDNGLHITINDEPRLLDVDHIIICAGQTSNNGLYEQAKENLHRPCHLIGGAHTAQEIDAKRAIKQGVELANQI